MNEFIIVKKPVFVTGCNCRWDGDTQVQWCELHLAHKEAQQPATGEPVAWCIEAQVDGEWFVQYPITFTKQGAELEASCYTPETVLRIRPLAFGDTTPQPVQATSAPADVVRYSERELELIDGMIAVQLDHAQRCDAISNRVMGEKQKGWDMERVELLRRIRYFGITAQTKKEQA